MTKTKTEQKNKTGAMCRFERRPNRSICNIQNVEQALFNHKACDIHDKHPASVLPGIIVYIVHPFGCKPKSLTFIAHNIESEADTDIGCK